MLTDDYRTRRPGGNANLTGEPRARRLGGSEERRADLARRPLDAIAARCLPHVAVIGALESAPTSRDRRRTQPWRALTVVGR